MKIGDKIEIEINGHPNFTGYIEGIRIASPGMILEVISEEEFIRKFKNILEHLKEKEGAE